MKKPELNTQLVLLEQKLVDAELHYRSLIKSVHPRQQESAANLIHYLAMRREDLRDLQDELHLYGLSSLASAESHTLQQIRAVLHLLGEPHIRKPVTTISALQASQLLRHRSERLFGPKVNPHIPHLMVTFDAKLAYEYNTVKELIEAGMNVARINCAHDNQEIWLKMVENIKKASRATGHLCKVYFDLAGPKLRTRILGKGRKKGYFKVKAGTKMLLADIDAAYNPKDKVLGCTLNGVVADIQIGDRLLFDDGLFEAVVDDKNEGLAQLTMVRVSGEKDKLKAGKGMNFPDTKLSVRSLTTFDHHVLPFAVKYGDIIGFSFLQNASDVAELQKAVRELAPKPVPLVLKIETFEATQNLPSILLQGMQESLFGVMIARGDLAVEIGFERLSEIQEEILWLCEAAHTPVIWATQVLENLNKSGLATRSELTDAAHAGQAECVMVNKGKYLLSVLSSLRNILHRSGGHHLKKRYLLRPLSIAEQPMLDE